MRIKIIQANSLNNLEAEINAWLGENPKAVVLNGNIQFEGDWRSCYAVLWHKEKTDPEGEGQGGS